MSQSYDDFVAANIGYDDERIPAIEPVEEPGYRESYHSILELESEVDEWSRINETLMPHIDEFDVVPSEIKGA